MKKKLLTLMVVISMSILSTACSIFGVETVEEAPFELVRQDDKFEIRDYESYVVVETSVNASYKKAGNQAFRKLFRYISGDNESSEKIAMTAPVISDSDESGEKIAMTAPVIFDNEGEVWRYRFVLPKTFTMDNAPRPTNPDVTLALIPQKRVAVLRYAGLGRTKAQYANAEKLAAWAESQGLVVQSAPRWAGYNAPWTLPPFRRNEVLIDISN